MIATSENTIDEKTRIEMQIGIIGVGALGSLFAALLAPVQRSHHCRVFLIGTWARQINCIKEKGLRINHLDGKTSRVRIPVYWRGAKAPRATVCLVLVKSYQTVGAVGEIAGLLATDGLCITLQNGLGNDELLASRLGAHRVTAGVTSQAATITEPGYVRHTGSGTTVIASNPACAPLVQRFAALLNDAGIHTEVVGDIRAARWQKLAINAAINPLTALLECNNGALSALPEMQPVIEQIAAEVVQVAQAEGVNLVLSEVLRQIRTVCKRTAANTSSMLQDIHHGRETEIEAISGKVVKLAQKHRLSAPINRHLSTLVKRKAMGESIVKSELFECIPGAA